MQRKRHLMISLTLIFLTVGFIWINSALSGPTSSEMSGRVKELLNTVLNFIHFPENAKLFLLTYIRKVAHATEYAVIGAELGFLWAGLHKGIQGVWNAFSSVLAIAVFDESIQIFSLSRGPQITDVLLDTVSGAVGILIVYLIYNIIISIRRAKE